MSESNKYHAEGKRKGMGENLFKVQLELQGQLSKLRRLIQRKTGYWVAARGIWTTAGGQAVETIPVVGLKANKVVHAQLNTLGAVTSTIKSVKTVDGAIEVTFDLDPSNTHVVNYSVVY